MFILPETIKDEDLDGALDRVVEEIKKLGGEVESKTRLGKRGFARRLEKEDAGHYAIITFSIDPDQIQPLLARYKLNDLVFRVQIVRAAESEGAAAGAETAGKEKKDGDA